MRNKYISALVIFIISLLVISCSLIIDGKKYYPPGDIQYETSCIADDNKSVYIIFNVKDETYFYPHSGEVKDSNGKLEVKIIRKNINVQNKGDENIGVVNKIPYLKQKGIDPYIYYLNVPNIPFDTICFTDGNNTKCIQR